MADTTDNRSLYIRPIYLLLFGVLAGFLPFLIAELVTLQLNRSKGIILPPLVHWPSKRGLTSNHENTRTIQRLDPLLGYAHEQATTNKSISFPFLQSPPGFVTFARSEKHLETRPLIVVLGGSTADSLMFPGSWPELLARMLEEQGYKNIVVNGAVGGYSTSQELLKLIRDVSELSPEVVISYDGINDGIWWSTLPHPMYHTYQKGLFTFLLRMSARGAATLLPNLSYFIWNELLPPASQNIKSIQIGVPTRHSSGSYLVRNVDYMQRLTETMGAEYIGILQPVAGIGSYKLSKLERLGIAHHGNGYLERVQAIYKVAQEAAQSRAYYHDFSALFDGMQHLYQWDGRHLNDRGNTLIAKEIFSLLKTQALLFPATESKSGVRLPQ